MRGVVSTWCYTLYHWPVNMCALSIHITTITLIMHYYVCTILTISITTFPSFNVHVPLFACLLFVTSHTSKLIIIYTCRWMVSVILADVLYSVTVWIFENGPGKLWCSHNLSRQECCKISSPGQDLFHSPTLFGGPLLDHSHLVGSHQITPVGAPIYGDMFGFSQGCWTTCQMVLPVIAL